MSYVFLNLGILSKYGHQTIRVNFRCDSCMKRGRHLETEKRSEMEGTGKPQHDAVIIVSSDDEDEDVEEIFKAFVSKVEQFVSQREVTLLLKMKFLEAPREIVYSTKFKGELKWRAKKLSKTNGYFHSGEILNLLSPHSKQDVLKSEANSEKKTVDRKSSVAGQTAREVALENTNIIQVTIDNWEEDKLATRVKKITTELPSPQPSTSSTSISASKRAETKKTMKRKQPAEASNGESKPDFKPSKPSKLPLTPRKRKRVVRRLEEKLRHVSERIRILNQAELSLDEMNMSDSTYIQECRLKDRFNRIWNKICKIRGRPSDTGRVIEKEVKCPPTGYSEIDRAVGKFLKKKRGQFPDKFDISNVILEANKKHGLKLSPQVLSEISQEIFICVGNKLQTRRKLDFKYNFGCSLTDDCAPEKDPAVNDAALCKKLEENKKVNKRALDEVFDKFTHYGRLRNQEESGDSSSSESEKVKPEKSRERETKHRFSRISVVESSDSDKECDDFGEEIEEASDNDLDNTEDIFEQNSLSGNTVKKAHSVFMSRDNSDLGLDDHAIKNQCQTVERTNDSVPKSAGARDNICSKESNVEIDGGSTMASQTKEIDVSSNYAIVKLPSPVLSESTSTTVERTNVSYIHLETDDNDSRDPWPVKTETTVEPGVNKKQTSESALEGCEISCVQSISKYDPDSDSAEKRDSNLEKEDVILTVRPSGSSSLVSSSAPVSNVSSRDMPGVSASSVADTSDSSTFVADAKISTKKSLNELSTKGNPLETVSLGNHDSVTSRLSGKQSVVIPQTPVSKPSLLSLSTKKRKAENGSLDYESPLKIFRKTTLETERKKRSSASTEMDISKQGVSCEESFVSCGSENDELSIAVSTANSLPNTANGHSSLRDHAPRKLALSLNKTGRNTPKKPHVNISDVIVLSDDDSDS